MEIGTKTPTLNWKYKVVSALIVGAIYGLILYLMDLLTGSELKSTGRYTFQAVFFGLFMGIVFPYLAEKLGKKFTLGIGQGITPKLNKGEAVETEGVANLFRRLEGVGGKIFLTNQKLIFKSHRFNIQNGQTDIMYSDVAEVIERKTAKLIDNGIRIKTKDGKEFDFVVNEREKWIEKLNEKIK